MVTQNSIYGLTSTQGKGKFSLQTLGTKAVEDDTQAQPSQSPWAAKTASLTPQAQGVENMNRVQLTPAQIAANFQWTGPYDAANRALQQQESDAGLSRSNTLAQIASSFLEANRQAEGDYTKGRRRQWEGLADRGIVNSSPALEAVTEYDTEFNSYLDRLAKTKAYDEMGVENQYASTLNQLGRQREGLASQQQAEEEARRVEEAKLAAEAERQAREEENRRQQIQQMIAAQEQARLAAEAASQAALAASYTYSAPGGGDYGFSGGGYDGGGFSGGYEEAPAPAPAAPARDMVVLPAFAPGVTTTAVDSWIKKNVDPNVSGTALKKVREVLSKAGPGGVSRSDIAWLIGQHPNTPATNVARSAASIAKKLW